MDTIITDGSGAGQLEYGSSSFVAANPGGYSDVVITRTFANSHAATLDVEEIGLYIRNFFSAGSIYYHCVLRDVLGSNKVGLVNGETLTVNYKIRSSVASGDGGFLNTFTMRTKLYHSTLNMMVPS